MIMDIMSFTREQFEDALDGGKVVVLNALVSEGLIAEDVAEQWASCHTIRIRKKGLWRTLSERWTNAAPSSTGEYYVVVKDVQ